MAVLKRTPVAKRTPTEEAELKAVLRVQKKKHETSLADAMVRLARRNLEMAAYLKSIGVELPDYYADVPAKKRGAR